MSAYVLSPEALQDLQTIWDFIAADNATAADQLLDEFFDAFERLSEWPRLGHARSDVTDREVLFWPVGSYLVVYSATRAILDIVAILHGARDIPTVMRER